MSFVKEPAMSEKNNQPAAIGWTFLTNHSHVLICLHQDSSIRLRDVAEAVGITERAVQRIVQELEEAGVISRHREGRRNVYEVHTGHHLRHQLEGHCSVGDLLKMVERRRTSRKA